MSSSSPFALERPPSVAEALAALAAEPEARVMGGGQSLVPLLTLGLAAPPVVVSLDRCDGLADIEIGPDGVTVGAMVTTRRVELDAGLGARLPLLARAAASVGSPHVRNFGTLAGNLCHADPGSDLIPAALCLEAELEVESAHGRRRIGVGELIDGPFSTGLRPGEMAVAVRFPALNGSWRGGYRKLVRRAGDLAMACAAVMARVTDGAVTEARVALGGPLRRAVRVRALEADLAGVAAADATATVLDGGWMEEVADDLLPDATMPADYLKAMLPRFTAAAVAETIGTEP